MKRIDTPTAVPNLHGKGKNGWRNGNPQAGVRPTQFNADWCNSVQEELANAIEGFGVALDAKNNNQLFDVLQKNGIQIACIDDLREYTGRAEVVNVKAYHEGGITGGGLFVADKTDKDSADNGGTIIVADNGTRWKRVGAPTVWDFGARGNGIDDTAVFKAAVAVDPVPVYVPAGTYYVSANVFGGNLWTDGPVVFVGAYAASVPNIKDQTASRLRAVCADMAAGKPIKIACYGDSTTDGNATTGWTQNPVDAAGKAVGTIDHESTAPNAWPAKLKTILRDMYKNDNIAVYNAGYSGRRMSNGWAYQNYDQAITNNPSYGKPDLCFIGFGLNDIADTDFAVSKFCQNLELLLQKMLAVGTVPVVLACDAHRRGGGNVRDRARSSRQLDEGKRALCEQYGVPYFAIDEAEKDFWEKNADGHQWWAGMIDGLHYGDVGHAFKAAWVAAQLYKDVYRYDGTSQVLENLDSRNSFGGDYNASYNVTRGRLGYNVTWSAANAKTGDAVVEAWIWVEDPQAKLIYRGVDNESIDAGIFDAANMPTIVVHNAVQGDVRYTPSNVGAARVIETSAVGDEPTRHRMVDMPYIVGHLSYGLNKVQYLTSGPRDDNALLGYCGYFDLISSPHQDGAPKNVLMHCGPIVLNSQKNDSKSFINLAPPSSDGANLVSMPFDAGYQSGLDFYIDAQAVDGTGIVLLSNTTFYDASYPANGGKCSYYIYFAKKTINDVLSDVVHFGVLYSNNGYRNAHHNIFMDKPVDGLGERFVVRIQRISATQQRLRLFAGWRMDATPLIDELIDHIVPLAGVAGGVFINSQSQSSSKSVILNQMMVVPFF